MRCSLDTLELARNIANHLEEKKGENILLIDIRELADFAEYFVICSGTSERMLRALASDVQVKVKEQYQIKGRIEGQPNDGWVLVDFGDVVVHLLSPNRRDYYRLEELWARGKILLRLQ